MNRKATVPRPAAMALSMLMLTVVAVVASPSQPAMAVCAGTGNAVTFSSGTIGIESYQYTSTCDGDNWYYGKYKDSSTPNGSCMWIKYIDDGIIKTTVSNCSSSSYLNYNYYDASSQATTYICDGYGCSSGYNNRGF